MNTQIVFVGLYTYYNVPLRTLHPLIDKIEGVDAHTIFYKNYAANKFNLPTEKEEEIFVDVIKKLNPKLVGISLLSPYVEIAKRLTYLIKKNTSALVCWGGVGPTITPDDHIKYTDIICVGEGERAFEELSKAVRDGEDYKKIKNLWINDGSKIIKNPLGPLVQDLDSLPFYEYGNDNYYFIEGNKLTKEDPELDNPELMLQSSRGCPYSCSFCIETMYHDLHKGLGKFVRRRTVDNTIKEIQWHFNKKDNKKKYIYFIDEVFGSNAPWIDEFAERYKKEVNKPFTVLYHPKTLKPRIIERLNHAGVDMIMFGIQTGSDYIRNKIYERPGTNAEVIELVHEITNINKNIKIRYDMILDNDFETKETLKECIDLILHLPKPVLFNLFSLKHFPGYPLTKKAIEAGHVTEEEVGDWPEQIKSTTENWKYKPRWIKRKKTRTKQLQRLNNIIWLMCWNRASDRVVKYGVFGKSIGSRIVFHYLNIKACLLGTIIGGDANHHSRWHYLFYTNKWSAYPLQTLKLIFTGNLKQLSLKLNRIWLRSVMKSSVKWNNLY